mgnify:CR=1 FL=1
MVYIKVAGQTDNGKPCLLNKSQFSALKQYVNEIKDAGVSVQLRNEEADLIKINLFVYYDPTLMNERGELSEVQNLWTRPCCPSSQICRLMASLGTPTCWRP